MGKTGKQVSWSDDAEGLRRRGDALPKGRRGGVIKVRRGSVMSIENPPNDWFVEYLHRLAQNRAKGSGEV